MTSPPYHEIESSAGTAVVYIPGKPPRPFIASIWRIIFFAPPPFIIFITQTG